MMSDEQSPQPTTPEADVESPDKRNVLFEHKLPGVWGKIYEKESKEGKPAVFGRIRRYRKTDDGYADQDFINSMTDCDNLIEVAYELKKFMRGFYAERESQSQA